MKRLMPVVACAVACLVALTEIRADTLEWARKEKDKPQLTENQEKPSCRFAAVFIPRSRLEGPTTQYGRTSMMELEFDSLLVYYHNTIGGDIDANLDGQITLILDSAGVQLPDQVGRVALDIGWMQRYYETFATQIRIMPGIYSDLEELDTDIFFMPFSVGFVRTYSKELTGTLGVDVRLGFNRLLMPRLGLTWDPSDACRVEAMLPESKVMYSLSEDWRAHAGFTWNNVDYRLRERGDFSRGQITVEDFRLALGLTRYLSDQLQVCGEIGEVFGRSLEFQKDVPGLDSDLDMERAMFVRFSLSGPF